MFDWLRNLFKKEPVKSPIFVTANSIVQRGIKAKGTIITIGVDIFSDLAGTIPVYSLEWGNMSPSGTYTRTLYIKNKGSTEVKLNMLVGAWNPVATSSYLTMTWDKENTMLSANQLVPFVMTAKVSPNITGITTWGCNITYQGTTI